MEGSGGPEMEMDKNRHGRWDVASVGEREGGGRKEKKRIEQKTNENNKMLTMKNHFTRTRNDRNDTTRAVNYRVMMKEKDSQKYGERTVKKF